MASKKTYEAVDIEDVVKKALEELKNNQLIDDYEKNEEKITEVLKEAAKTEAELTTNMVHMIDTKTMREVEKEMSTIIGHERVELIKKSFAIETYRMNVVKKPDGQLAVQVHREGNEFLPEIMLMTINDLETATVLQWASLVIELFLFVFRCVDVNVDLNTDEMGSLVQEVEGFVREPAFQKVLTEFLEAWSKPKATVWGKAKAIFILLKGIFLLGSFWKIAKLIINKMSWWERAKALAKVAALIVAAITTGGTNLINKIAIALQHSIRLAEKIANLIQFSDMKKTMK